MHKAPLDDTATLFEAVLIERWVHMIVCIKMYLFFTVSAVALLLTDATGLPPHTLHANCELKSTLSEVNVCTQFHVILSLTKE